ncbi:FH1/FH2 domain-containing protein 3 [Nymphon striatum]|nr:FH1/FH2 domain-containing protein 3 [Nymphon striatum]
MILNLTPNYFEGLEAKLRRKRFLKDDKDLVHEFVQNDGLACLIKVGSEADQNYQNYILRALGQVMLYVDGMNGVIAHIEMIQWLYSLISSKYRLVVKTTLKLLLVFVEYTESNCLLLINAINAFDSEHHHKSWSHIMLLLNERDAVDMELLIFAVTLINKTLNGIPDQDTYYDMVDSLEEQGMEKIIQRYMFKQGTNLDLLQQFQIYEAVLKHEDGDDDEHDRRKSRRHSVGNVITPQQRRPLRSSMLTTTEENGLWRRGSMDREINQNDDVFGKRSSMSPVQVTGSLDNDVEMVNGITPALRKRREREARHRTFIKEQEENCDKLENLPIFERQKYQERIEDENQKNLQLTKQAEDGSLKPPGVVKDELRSSLPLSRSDTSKKSWMLGMMYQSKSQDDSCENGTEVGPKSLCRENSVGNELHKSNSHDNVGGNVRGLQEKLSKSGSDVLVNGASNGDRTSSDVLSGVVERAKEGLARGGSQADIKLPGIPANQNIPSTTDRKTENDHRQWEQLINTLKRPLIINDLDFTDLIEDDDVDITLRETNSLSGLSNGQIPPAPPPLVNGNIPPPPPLRNYNFTGMIPPAPFLNLNNCNGQSNKLNSQDSSNSNNRTFTKNKKTIKLFWREVHDKPSSTQNGKISKSIWDEIKPVAVDKQKLEHLFESRGKDHIVKNKQEVTKKSIVTVLGAKRSNAINIGMTKLPPLRALKTAILKMDGTIINQEGIEKILTMLPKEEETAQIQEAQMLNPDIPLGTAEQFLLTLSSISELWSRLKLWAFKLDYEQLEKEIAEPLMDLKQGLIDLRQNQTFHVILATLRSIGNFLNGKEVKGFHLDYLAKVPEVKDTVHKHSLLHHLCHMVMEKSPDSSDLYSELGAITRVSKVDFDELESNLFKLEAECKASWDYLKAVCKHDSSVTLKVRYWIRSCKIVSEMTYDHQYIALKYQFAIGSDLDMLFTVHTVFMSTLLDLVRSLMFDHHFLNGMTDFLTDVAERIVVVLIIHRRVINRFYKTLEFFGTPVQSIKDTKINEICKIISEFALEYRTTRERVIQQMEKKANHRERNKTRGKMITDMGKFKTKETKEIKETKEQKDDQELRQLLGNGMTSDSEPEGGRKWGTLPGMRSRYKFNSRDSGSLGRNISRDSDVSMTDADDEILESLVKTATAPAGNRNIPRERKRARQADRKSCMLLNI